MSDILIKIFILIGGYLVGSIVQSGYWLGKIYKIDIREHGSGNAGTTNVMRTLGKKVGFLTYFFDTFKVIFADLIIHFFVAPNTAIPEMLLFLYCGLGVVLGHNFPFYMNFKGGKGIATSSGVVISLMFFPKYCFILTILGVSTFFLVAFISKYVSLGSLVGMAGLFVEFVIMGLIGFLPSLDNKSFIEASVIIFILSALAFVRHSANIKRLINGTERKIGEKSKAN